MTESIPDGITYEDVITASSDLDKGIQHEFTTANQYNVIYNVKKYSPRTVVGLAARRLAGRQLIPKDFRGGYESKCYWILKGLGFEIRSKTPVEIFPDEVDASAHHIEGAVHQVLVNRYERDAGARKKCLDRFGYRCSVCDFDFESTYEEIGQRFIHVHHLREISSIREAYVVAPINDLRPVCPNCHAMLHSRRPAITTEELRHILRSQRDQMTD